MEINSCVINCGTKSETGSAGVSVLSTAGYRAHKKTGLVQKEKETYIDDAFFVPHQQVPEEPGLVQIPQPDHVIHTLHGGGVHGPEGNLLVDLVLLHTSYHRMIMTLLERNHLQIWTRTFPSSSIKYSCPASVTFTSAPIGTPEPESNHTKSPFMETASGDTDKEGSMTWRFCEDDQI